jgi:hypothetical protein
MWRLIKTQQGGTVGGILVRIQDANSQWQGAKRILDFFRGKAIVGVPGFGWRQRSGSLWRDRESWNKRDYLVVEVGNFPGCV